MKKLSSLQSKKFYRVKQPSREFLCALCSAPRQMRYSKFLSVKNYLQVILLTATLSYFLFPLMKAKVVFLFFPVWLAFELGNKLLYRKELPCPYCGFDPSWYRRDVRVAKKMVQNFWQTHYPDLVGQKEAAILEQDPENLGINPVSNISSDESENLSAPS